MALIQCPECGREISDTLAACPHCGYAFKKKKKWVLPVIIALIVAVAGGILSYFLYFKPNSILDQAENLIARKKYSEADVLLASVSSNSRKDKLLAQICIAEAREAITSGNYALAEEKLKFISSDAIPKELLDDINKQKADVLVGQGRYVEADQYYSSLEQTDDILKIRKELFYESRILDCALQTKASLIFPESMVIKEAVTLYGGTEKNEFESTDDIEIREYKQPEILLHYQAKTRGGSVTDGFQRYTWDMDTQTYSQHISVDSLTVDETTPSYVEYLDYSDQLEYYEKQREISFIKLKLLLGYDESLNDDQIKRINVTIQGLSSMHIDIIPNNEVVPLPTPQVVQITPNPETGDHSAEVPDAVAEVVEEVPDAATAVEEKAEEVKDAAAEAVAELAVMSHADYDAASADNQDPVYVETYVQATQSWYEGKITIYAQSPDGAYFIYNAACSEEDAAKLVPGTKIAVKGNKAAWSSEVEIVDATIEILEGDSFIAEAFDATELLAKEDELIAHQNEKVSFKGLTVAAQDDGAAFNYKNAENKTDDLYVRFTKDEGTYNFCVEFYLCGNDTEVYKTVEGLQVGDVVDVEGFLYWYNGANVHMTKVTKAE